MQSYTRIKNVLSSAFSVQTGLDDEATFSLYRRAIEADPALRSRSSGLSTTNLSAGPNCYSTTITKCLRPIQRTKHWSLLADCSFRGCQSNCSCAAAAGGLAPISKAAGSSSAA